MTEVWKRYSGIPLEAFKSLFKEAAHNWAGSGVFFDNLLSEKAGGPRSLIRQRSFSSPGCEERNTVRHDDNRQTFSLGDNDGWLCVERKMSAHQFI